MNMSLQKMQDSWEEIILIVQEDLDFQMTNTMIVYSKKLIFLFIFLIINVINEFNHSLNQNFILTKAIVVQYFFSLWCYYDVFFICSNFREFLALYGEPLCIMNKTGIIIIQFNTRSFKSRRVQHLFHNLFLDL